MGIVDIRWLIKGGQRVLQVRVPIPDVKAPWWKGAVWTLSEWITVKDVDCTTKDSE